MKRKFCVVGTDARQHAAAQALQCAGFAVAGAESAGDADYILLPMPMDAEKADLARILRAARPGAVALGGKVSPPVQCAANAAGVELVDYFLRPELAAFNAVPTAEGCLELLLHLRERTIWQSRALVLGYGHVGSAVATRLTALGAMVAVAARCSEQRATAQCRGCRATELTGAAFEETLRRAEVIVNSIPAPVLGAPQLALLVGGALVVDLASAPGGTDFEAARRLNVHAVHALSLPARCAPRTAGELVAKTVLSILKERGGLP